MATNRWLGTASAVAQVDTFTPGGTIEADDRFILTVTNEAGQTHVLNVQAGGTTVGAVCDALVAAWNADTSSFCTPITASLVGTSPNGTAIRLTADTPGVPFYVAASTTEAGGGASDGQTFTRTATTENSGPNAWNTAANWSLGSVPTTGDNVYIEDSSVAISYGLNQSSVTLSSLNIGQSYTASAGIGSTDAYLRIGATIVNIGYHYSEGSPSGCGRIKLDLGSAQTTVTVLGSASAGTDTNRAPTQILGTNASNVLYVLGGRVSVANTPGEVSTFAVINQSYMTSKESGSYLYIGPGVTLTTFTKIGGIAYLQCGATTVTHRGGTLTTRAGAITTLNNYGGTVYCNSSGTITTLNCYGGVTDFTRSRATRTVTTPTIYAGATLRYDKDVVTFTNKLAAGEPVSLAAAEL